MFIPTKEHFCNITPEEFEKYSLKLLIYIKMFCNNRFKIGGFNTSRFRTNANVC